MSGFLRNPAGKDNFHDPVTAQSFLHSACIASIDGMILRKPALDWRSVIASLAVTNYTCNSLHINKLTVTHYPSTRVAAAA